MVSDTVPPESVATPHSPTSITAEQNNGQDIAGGNHQESPLNPGDISPGRLPAEKPVFESSAGPSKVNSPSEPSAQAILLEIRDLLSALAPKAEPPKPADPATESQDPPTSHSPKFGDLENYWSHFDTVAKEESDGMIKGMKDNLDNLLIFAALFSAVNSGFLALSLPGLSDDPSAETNTLLRLLVQDADNSTLTPADLVPPPFTPSPTNWLVNQLFSTSLTLSLLAAFGAILAQQWIVHYTRQTPGAVDGGRWDREQKFEGAQRWKLQAVVEMFLPILLQAALGVFAIGFIVFLRNLGWRVALPNLILTIIGITAFLLSTIFSSWDPFCPFQTPYTTITIFIARYCGVIPVMQRIWQACLRILLTPPALLLSVVEPDEGRGGLRRTLWKTCLDWFYRHPIRWWQFATDSWTFAQLRRSAETTEVLQDRAVRRFLETSGHVQFLKATAVNLPLPFHEVEGSGSGRVKDGRLRRLVSLFHLARRRSNQQEQLSYATAISHLLVTQKELDIDDIPTYLIMDAAAGSLQAHFGAPSGRLPNTTSSLAAVALTFTGRFRDTEADRKCIRQISDAVDQDQFPLLPICGILSLLMGALPAPRTGCHFHEFATGSNPTLQAIRSVIHEDTVVERLRIIEAIRSALGKYDPTNDLSHELVMGILKALRTALDSMDWKDVVQVARKVVPTNLTSPEALGDRRENAKINQEEAAEAALSLVSGFLVRTEREIQDSMVRESQVWSHGRSVRIDEEYRDLFEESLLQCLPSWTCYADALHKKHRDGQPIAARPAFHNLLGRLRNIEGLREIHDAIKFRRAVAALPEDVVKLPEELKKWVDEALTIELEEERAQRLQQESTSANNPS